MAFEFTDKNFQAEALDKKGITVVDFWAEWCGPCRTLAPVIEKLADDYKGVVNIGKMDVDNNPEIPSKYGVRGIPTLIFLKDGVLIEKLVGPKPSIIELGAKIEKFLAVSV